MVEIVRMVLSVRIAIYKCFDIYFKHIRLNKNLCIPVKMVSLTLFSTLFVNYVSIDGVIKQDPTDRRQLK